MSNFFAFLGDWYAANKAGIDNPLMNRPDHFADQDVLGVEGYQKPGAVLLALRDHVVGAESMDRAMREYVHRWAFKHPTPGDFFRTVENVAGKDLSWFWKSFFYTTDVLDIGIDSVSTKPADDGRLVASVQLQRHTSVVFPVELRLALADGSTKDITLPVDIWSRGMTFTAEIPVSAEVKGARLWPDRSSIPDMNPKNDTWGTPPAGDPPHPATVGGLAPVISAR